MLLTAMKSVVFATAFLCIWTLAALRVEVYDRRLGGALPSWTWWPGVAAFVVGAVLATCCVAWLIVRGEGTPAPFDPPRAFVSTGPYRWVRNPMYIGGVLMLTGLGLMTQSPAVLLFAPAVWLLMHLFVTLYEERSLRRRFGVPYERYCRSVSRWLPKAPPHPLN